MRGPVQPHLAGLQRRHAQLHQLSRCRIQTRQIEQTKIRPILIVAADALVVIDQIPTAVQDQLPAVDLDGPRMVGGVPMHHVDAAVDQAVREADLIGCDAVAPVAAPMCGDDCQVTRLSRLEYLVAKLIGSGIAEGSDDMDAGSVIGGRPLVGDAAGRRTEGKDQDPSACPRDRDDRRRLSLAQ